MRVLSAGLIAVGLLVSGNVAAAGFDCAKAGTKIEKQICANPTLDQLDSDLNSVYKSVSGIDGVKQNQRDWVKNVRNQAANDDIMIIVYNQRIAELEKMIAAPAPVGVVKSETVNEPIKTKRAENPSDNATYKNFGVVLASMKICKDNYQVSEELASWAHKTIVEGTKEKMGNRYSPEEMKKAYQFGISVVSRFGPADLMATCNEMNILIGSIKEEEEAEEMEF